MRDPEESESERPRPLFHYRGTLPPVVALLLVFPVLFLFLSFAALALAGGTVATLFLPLLFGRRRPTSSKDKDADCVTLEPNEYSRVDPESRRLPPP